MKGFDLVDPSETDANAGRGRPGWSRGQSAADGMEPVSPGNGRYCGRQGQPGRAFSDCPAVNTDRGMSRMPPRLPAVRRMMSVGSGPAAGAQAGGSGRPSRGDVGRSPVPFPRSKTRVGRPRMSLDRNMVAPLPRGRASGRRRVARSRPRNRRQVSPIHPDGQRSGRVRSASRGSDARASHPARHKFPRSPRHGSAR